MIHSDSGSVTSLYPNMSGDSQFIDCACMSLKNLLCRLKRTSTRVVGRIT